MNNFLTRNQWLVVVACIIVSLSIDWLDYVTGEEYELFILYYIPVAIIAWQINRTAGLLMAIFCTATWFQSDFLAHPHYSLFIGSWDTAMRMVSFVALAWTLSQVRTELTREKKLNTELADAMAQIKTLSGILPMCSFCRKIRDDKNQWVPLESYISKHSDAQVSHGLCPICYKKHYGEENGT
jgi:K+-sensing histidine kinase KdpD